MIHLAPLRRRSGPIGPIALLAALFLFAPAARAADGSGQAPAETRTEDAPATRSLSLRDAVARALENDAGIAVSRLAPKIADARVLSSKGVFDAVLSAGGTYSRSTSQTGVEQSLTLNGQPPVQISRRLTGRTELSKFWATGTQTGVTLSANRPESNFSPREYNASAAFTVRQSLLRGLRPAANLASVRQASNDAKSSRYRLRADVINLVASVETTFWSLALDHALLGVRRYSVELAEGQLERTLAFVEVGKLPPVEAASAEAELATRRSDLIEARNNVQKRAIDLARLTETDLAGAASGPLPWPADEAVIPALTGTDAQSLELAFRSRPDLFQAHLDLENGELEVVRTRDGLLPVLDLAGTYGLTGRGLEFHDARARIEEREFDNYNLGLDFEMPLPNRRARGDHRAAKWTREQLDLSLENLRREIQAGVLKARIDLENRIEAVEAFRAALRLQEEKVRIEEAKWLNGLATTLDVLRAQRDLIQSRSQVITGVANAIISEVNLYVEEGTLLEVRGLETEGGEELK